MGAICPHVLSIYKPLLRQDVENLFYLIDLLGMIDLRNTEATSNELIVKRNIKKFFGGEGQHHGEHNTSSWN